jgi:hypothetical protein
MHSGKVLGDVLGEVQGEVLVKDDVTWLGLEEVQVEVSGAGKKRRTARRLRER